MQKKSMKQLSVLGLVLMAASAVTAAIIPAKEVKSSGDGNNNGTIVGRSASAAGPANVFSCMPREFDNQNTYSCTRSSSNTNTTGFFIGNDSTVSSAHRQTQGNTSLTKAVPGDQNSVLVP